MKYLLDTNIVSELRKGERANSNVQTWFDEIPEESLFLRGVTRRPLPWTEAERGRGRKNS